jgi:hypothetical protein
MVAGTTSLFDQQRLPEQFVAGCGGKKADQVVQERGQQVGWSAFHVSQLVGEPRRCTTAAPEIRQCLAALLINIDACRRWVSADPPNIRQARAAAERMTSNANALTKLIITSGHDDHA